MVHIDSVCKPAMRRIYGFRIVSDELVNRVELVEVMERGKEIKQASTPTVSF